MHSLPVAAIVFDLSPVTEITTLGVLAAVVGAALALVRVLVRARRANKD